MFTALFQRAQVDMTNSVLRTFVREGGIAAVLSSFQDDSNEDNPSVRIALLALALKRVQNDEDVEAQVREGFAVLLPLAISKYVNVKEELDVKFRCITTWFAALVVLLQDETYGPKLNTEISPEVEDSCFLYLSSAPPGASIAFLASTIQFLTLHIQHQATSGRLCICGLYLLTRTLRKFFLSQDPKLIDLALLSANELSRVPDMLAKVTKYVTREKDILWVLLTRLRETNGGLSDINSTRYIMHIFKEAFKDETEFNVVTSNEHERQELVHSFAAVLGNTGVSRTNVTFCLFKMVCLPGVSRQLDTLGAVRPLITLWRKAAGDHEKKNAGLLLRELARREPRAAAQIVRAHLAQEIGLLKKK
jgi:hypothetical protein